MLVNSPIFEWLLWNPCFSWLTRYRPSIRKHWGLYPGVWSSVCGPQGDLRRMWSEPFHTKNSGSRFLEVWCTLGWTTSAGRTADLFPPLEGRREGTLTVRPCCHHLFMLSANLLWKPSEGHQCVDHNAPTRLISGPHILPVSSPLPLFCLFPLHYSTSCLCCFCSAPFPSLFPFFLFYSRSHSPPPSHGPLHSTGLVSPSSPAS